MYKPQQILNLLFVIIAVIILCDFVLPGTIFNEQINVIKKERQDYNNAAKNSHDSYTVKTHKHQFSVSEDFAKIAHKDDTITYSVSLFFKEINQYGLKNTQKNNIYSLRWVSGLVIPLFLLLAIAMTFFFDKKLDLFISVLQIVLLANLIFLIFW